MKRQNDKNTQLAHVKRPICLTGQANNIGLILQKKKKKRQSPLEVDKNCETQIWSSLRHAIQITPKPH